MDRLGEHRAGKALHVEFLHGDVRVILHKPTRQFVQVVATARGDLRLVPGDSALCALPARRVTMFPRQRPLAVPKAFGRSLRSLRRRDCFTCRESDEARQADVHSHGLDGTTND